MSRNFIYIIVLGKFSKLHEIPDIEEFEIKYVSETKKGESLRIGYEKQGNIIYACGENEGKTSFVAKIIERQ